jgi:predicted RecB family endonuclease
MKENQIAVESGLRTEIAENFMGSLKDLFVESYIEVPESKVNLVDELAEQVSELEEKLNAQTGSAIEMSEQIETLQREAIIRESAGDLADTQVEKLKGLVESLDFEDAESFAHKVKTVKESYFKKDVAVVEEEINEDWTAEASAPASGSVMEQYLTAIKKSNK